MVIPSRVGPSWTNSSTGLAHHIRGADPVPNFINPFWMLPLLGILGLKSKDLILHFRAILSHRMFDDDAIKSALPIQTVCFSKSEIPIMY